MKWVKISSLISALLFIAYRISRWFLIPNLLPHPPTIAGPVGRYMWLNSLNKDLRLKIIYITYFSLFILISGLFFYILNVILRIKYRKWDKQFLCLSFSLLLPTIPSIILQVISLAFFLFK